MFSIFVKTFEKLPKLPFPQFWFCWSGRKSNVFTRITDVQMMIMMTTKNIETLIQTIYWWQESLSVDPMFFLQFRGMGGGLITYLDQMPNIMAFESKSTNFRVEKDNKIRQPPLP